jgi:hypothetical protein
MRSILIFFAMLVSVNSFADSSVVNQSLGPVSLVRKVVSFPIEDCINRLEYFPGSDFYNWRCVIPLTDTVGALKLEPFDVQWGSNAFDGKCLCRVTANANFAAIELNRVPGHPVLPKDDAMTCLQKAYSMANINAGIAFFVLTIHANVDATPVVTPIENPTSEQGSPTGTAPVRAPKPIIRKPVIK